MIVTLKSSLLTVEIDDFGAQMSSVKDTAGTEYIWQADPAIWARHAPTLFPVIARLQDGQYTHKGQTYSITSHGFARDNRFQVVESSGTHAVFRLTENEKTLAMYPFPFRLTISYRLEGTCLTKTTTVENTGAEEMPYELGNHDGFRIPLNEGEVMEDYAVILPGVDTLTPYGMDENLMTTPKGKVYPLTNGRIPVKPMSVGVDTFLLDELPQRQAHLVDKNGKVRVTLKFEDFPYLGIWTKPMPLDFDTNYVCIEPWTTLPDATFVGRGLVDKQGIRILAPGASETFSYTTEFFE